MTYTDLSETHGLASDLIAPCENPEQFKLSDEQLAFYHENGYVADIKVLSEE